MDWLCDLFYFVDCAMRIVGLRFGWFDCLWFWLFDVGACMLCEGFV